MHSHSRIQEEPYSPSSLFLHHRGKRERKEMLICSLHIVAYILYIDFFPFSPGFTPLGLCAAVSQRVRRKDWVSHWIVKLVEKLLIRSWFCYCCLLRLLHSTRMEIFCCKTEKRVKEKKGRKCCTHFEADEEGEGHGDEDEEPAENGQDPTANADSRVAIIGCFNASHPRNQVDGSSE